MSLIRKSRLNKFKNKSWKWSIVAKLLFILICTVLTLHYVVSYTGAYFHDVERIWHYLHAEWEEPEPESDQSSLNFHSEQVTLQRGGTCDPPHIFAEVYNDGEPMTSSIWRWELFKVDGMNEGQPNIISEALDSGVIDNIETGNIGIIESNDDLVGDGDYRFIVKKLSGSETVTIWSEVITIDDCVEKKGDADKKPNAEASDPIETEDSASEAEPAADTETPGNERLPEQTEETEKIDPAENVDPIEDSVTEADSSGEEVDPTNEPDESEQSDEEEISSEQLDGAPEESSSEQLDGALEESIPDQSEQAVTPDQNENSPVDTEVQEHSAKSDDDEDSAMQEDQENLLIDEGV